MAKKSKEFRNPGQSYLYLVQSENLVTLMEDLGYGDKSTAREFNHEIEKLRENMNYHLYVRDYWNISYGHHQLSTGSFRAAPSDLPNPPTENEETGQQQTPKKKEVKSKVKVTVEVHDTCSESSSSKRGTKLQGFDISESVDFDEWTHL